MEVALISRTGRWTQRTILQLLLILMYFIYESHGLQAFITQPTSITAKLGDKVTLPCKIGNRRGVVQWTKDGFGLGTNRTLHGFDRYEMTGSTEQGEYNLFIRAVLVSDDAEYQCQVGAVDGEPFLMSSKARLTVHVPPNNNEDMVFIDRPSPVTATAGALIRISCIARSSKPAPEIKWFNGNTEITTGTNKTRMPLPDSLLVSLLNTLDLTPTKSHHLANISCQVSHIALEEPIVRSIQMEVKYPPEVSIKVDSVKIKEGENVSLTCNGDANPPSLSYRWEVGDQAVVGDPGSTLFLQDVRRDKNKAVVACHVTNAIGEATAQHKLSVEYAPVFLPTKLTVDGDLGKEVSLACKVDGNPKPEVVWTHERSNKVKHLGVTMKVTVSPETVGGYYCTAAVPGYKEVEQKLQVLLRGPPRVLEGQESHGVAGEGVRVACRVAATPRPTSLTWNRGGQLILPDHRYKIHEVSIPDGIVNTLEILSAQDDDFGNYNCTATNSYGTDSGTVVLSWKPSLSVYKILAVVFAVIVSLVLVVAVVLFCRWRVHDYKDSSTFEKHSMQSGGDHSSTNDSVLKVDTRCTDTYTGTGSELSPSDGDEDNEDEDDDEDGDYSNDEWDEEQGRGTSRNSGRYSTDIDGQTNASGAYVPYVDYQRDYNPPQPVPPLPLNYNRNTIYTSVPLNNLGPRYSLGYSGPAGGRPPTLVPRHPGVSHPQRVAAQPTYLRLPANARLAQTVYGSSGALAPHNHQLVFSPNLGPPNTNFGANVAQTNMNFGSSGGGLDMAPPNNFQSISNNLNDPSNALDKNAIYSQISRNRNNLRKPNVSNSQYISIPQNDLGRGGLGTHI